MAKERNAFKLGLAVIVMLGLFFAVLIFLAGKELGVSKETVVVRFAHDSVLPVLEGGSPVFCGASQVGDVADVWFGGTQPDSTGREEQSLFVYVRARVNSSLGLRSDCKIVAQGPLLGGTGHLLIRSRGVSGAPVDESSVIEGQQAGTFQALTEMLAGELDANAPNSLMAGIKSQIDPADASSLIAKIHLSLDDVNAISANLNREFDPDQRDVLVSKLHQILGNINSTTELLKMELEPGRETALLFGVHQAINSVNDGLIEAVAILKENRQPVHNTLLELESSIRTVNREILAQLVDEFNPDNADSILSGVHTAMDRANTALDDLTVISGTAKELVLLNKHNVNMAMTNLRVASEYLKGGFKYVFSQPWVLLNPPTDKDSKQRRTADAAREFSDAATKLDDALSQLRAVLELRGDRVQPDDQSLIEARLQLEEARSKFGQAESFLWRSISGG